MFRIGKCHFSAAEVSCGAARLPDPCYGQTVALHISAKALRLALAEVLAWVCGRRATLEPAEFGWCRGDSGRAELGGVWFGRQVGWPREEVFGHIQGLVPRPCSPGFEEHIAEVGVSPGARA